MLHLELETKDNTLKFSVPQSWQDVSFKDFMEFADHRDDMEVVISIITGLPVDFVTNPDYAEFVGRLLVEVEKLGDFPSLDKDPKSAWSYEGDYTHLNTSDFKWTISLSQQIDAVYYLQELKKKEEPTEKDTMDAFLSLCTTFMQPHFTKSDYDKKEADKLRTYFLEQPFEEVVRLGRFFLSKLMKSRSSSVTSHLKRNTILTKAKQGLRILAKPLASIKSYIAYRRAVRLSK